MRRAKFHPDAEAEFVAAARFYEEQRQGLGFEFLAEVQRALRTITDHPNRGRQFSRRIRQLIVQRFPYGLLYRVEPSQILVVAVAHLYRRPGYWRKRV